MNSCVKVYSVPQRSFFYFFFSCQLTLFYLQFFTVKLDEGILASSFQLDDKIYGNPEKLLPISRFLPKSALVNFFLCLCS